MKKKIIIAILSLIVILSWTGFKLWQRSDIKGTEIWFLDVGQGDATFIRDQEGTSMLIDAGPGGSVISALSDILPWWERDIDKIMLTHFDADHFIGFFAIINRFEIDKFYRGSKFPNTKEGRRLLVSISEKNIEEEIVEEGSRFYFLEGELEIIHPGKDPKNSLTKNKNESSLTSIFWCGEQSILLTADVGFVTEEKLMKKEILTEINILKVGHHGSAGSTSQNFLDHIKPETAIISVGSRNRYGHPAPRVVMELLSRGTDIHRTDREGNIGFVCNNGVLKSIR